MPATVQDLSSAIISALESTTVAPVVAPTDVVYDIMLAEDNMVNQKLAVKILEKYGHVVEIAENGALAVDAFKQRIAQGRMFDIILVSKTCNVLVRDLRPSQMDVSMPFMGGMEATELIRSYEREQNLARTPIIALTAHASMCCCYSPLLISYVSLVIGDRERCLQAGMDDHITSKCLWPTTDDVTASYQFTEPLRRQELLAAINKLAGDKVQYGKRRAQRLRV